MFGALVDAVSNRIHQEEHVLTIDFTAEDKEEYKKLEEKALAFYQSFPRRKVSKAFLRLTSALLPLRIACSGGHIPIEPSAVAKADNENNDETEGLDVDEDKEEEEDNETEDLDEKEDTDENEDNPPSKAKLTKKKMSEYAYKSKLDRLIKELVAVREEDPTCRCPACALLSERKGDYGSNFIVLS